MATLSVTGIDSDYAARMRAGGLDANGQAAIARPAVGVGNPCRHCLQPIVEGETLLLLAFRPFATAQPYAETGPIFLHQRDCPRYQQPHLPSWFSRFQPALVRGYSADDWIIYPTGNVVPGEDLEAECERILSHSEVAYVHIRSKFNCFQCRVERAAS